MRFLTLALASLLCHITAVIAGPVTVAAVFNVLYDEDDTYFDDSIIHKQMNVLNSFTSQFNLTFAVQTIRRMAVSSSVVHSWDTSAFAQRQIYKYRQGNAMTLNINAVGSVASGTPFIASYPWDYAKSPQQDGIIIDHDYLVGGKHENFNTGKMLVTAVGRWAGLLNTYEGGCEGAGDSVDDTPPEAPGAQGCPTGRNSCGGEEDDPIDNLMDSTDDTCRVRFTPGQHNRMALMLLQHRGIKLGYTTTAKGSGKGSGRGRKQNPWEQYYV